MALKDPKLIEIAKTAPLNAKNEPILTWAYKESFKYALEKIKDLKTVEELAISTRFLTKIRRDYQKEFAELVESAKSEIKKTELVKEIPKPPEPKRKFEEIEFEIPDFVELITKESFRFDYHIVRTIPLRRRLIRFPSDYSTMHGSYVRKFCLDILTKLIDTDSLEEKICIEQLVEFLEKKGLIIKICGNCANYYYYHYGSCDQLTDINRKRIFGDFCWFTPSKWLPKCLEEKK